LARQVIARHGKVYFKLQQNKRGEMNKIIHIYLTPEQITELKPVFDAVHDAFQRGEPGMAIGQFTRNKKTENEPERVMFRCIFADHAAAKSIQEITLKIV
jgi:hypothetical protein